MLEFGGFNVFFYVNRCKRNTKNFGVKGTQKLCSDEGPTLETSAF